MATLNKIIAWAQKEDAIRAVVLTGSRAHNSSTDFLADYDVTLFVTDASAYLADSSWIHSLGKVWVEVADKICVPGQKDYHTRLVIFEGGIKVDFAFFTMDVLTNFGTQADLVSRFARAYKVLFDKDGLTIALSASTIKAPPANKPSQQEFETVVKEFFFEAYHVAKYLHRNELWLVKFRDWATKEFLLRMLEWHARSQHGWNYDTLYQGKHVQSWIDKETWTALDKCFALFGAEDSWRALMATIELFRRVAKQTAEHFGYQYPTDVDKNITEFVQKVKTLSSEQYIKSKEMANKNIAFKPLEKKDLPLFFEWVKKPHIARWWTSDTYEKFVEKYRPEVATQNYVFPFIMYVNEKPIGYIQYYLTDKVDDGWWAKTHGQAGTIGMDIIIGETDYIGKGFGPLLIKKFIEKIDKETKTSTIIIDPSVANIAAIRCYEKVGFKRVKEIDSPTELFDTEPGKLLLMELKR